MTWLTFFDQQGHVVSQSSVVTSLDQLDLNDLLSIDALQPNAVSVVITQVPNVPVLPRVLTEGQYIHGLYAAKESDSVFLCVSPDATDDTLLQVYRLSDHHLLQTWTMPERILHLFGDGRSALVVDQSDYTAFVRRFLDGDHEDIIFASHTRDITAWSTLEAAQLLVTGGRDRVINVWDIEQGQRLETFRVQSYPTQLYIPTTEYIVGWEGRPALWVWKRSQARFGFTKEDIAPTVVTLHPDGGSLLVGCEDGTVVCYALADGAVRWQTQLSLQGVYALAASSYAIVCASASSLFLLEPATGQLRYELVGHSPGGIYCFQIISPTLLVSGGFDGTIRVWDMRHGQCLAILGGHMHRVEDLIVTASQQYIVSYDRAQRSIVWSINSSEFIQ